MKRKSVVLLVGVLMAGCLAFGASTLAQSAAAEEEGYSVSEFAELPADWQLNDQCDAENTSVTFENGEMVIRSEGSTSPQKYYGAMYFIDKDHGENDRSCRYVEMAGHHVSYPDDGHQYDRLPDELSL